MNIWQTHIDSRGPARTFIISREARLTFVGYRSSSRALVLIADCRVAFVRMSAFMVEM